VHGTAEVSAATPEEEAGTWPHIPIIDVDVERRSIETSPAIVVIAWVLGVALAANGVFMLPLPEIWYATIPGVPDTGPLISCAMSAAQRDGRSCARVVRA